MTDEETFVFASSYAEGGVQGPAVTTRPTSIRQIVAKLNIDEGFVVGGPMRPRAAKR